MLTSTGVWVEGEDQQYSHLIKQSVFSALGIVAAIIFIKCDYSLFKKWKGLVYTAFIVSTILLALLYIPGVGKEVNGSTRWLQFPVIGRFQPSELAKLTTIMALSLFYAHYRTENKSLFKGFIWPSCILGVVVVLIFFEKDMGTAASLGAAGLAVIYMAGARLRYIIPSLLIAFSAMSWDVRRDENRWNRIMAFLDLENNALGAGYQQMRALCAFGNGGLEGVGVGYGAEKRTYLPFPHTDFIFANIGEELGWVTFIVVLCFLLYALAGICIAYNAKDLFGTLLATGLTTIVVVPAMVNIGVNTASLPNTGLPLPFVSYGGTNLFVTIASAGMLIGIGLRSRQAKDSSDDNPRLQNTDLRI